jgi:HK97 gp10 family phage protein
VSVKIVGLQELYKQLKRLDPEVLQKVMRAATRKSFAKVISTAKSLVPVESGALRESIRMASEKGAQGTKTAMVVGLKIAGGGGSKQAAMAAAAFGEGQSKNLPPARRWHFTELGTSKIPAKSFARRALDESKDAVLGDLKMELDKMIQKAVKK